MTALRSNLPLAAACALAGLVAGCSTVETYVPGFGKGDGQAPTASNPNPQAPVAKPAVKPEEQVKVLPIAGVDLECPTVDVAEGGSALRVGGADNASVRYQFNIMDTARECDPLGAPTAITPGAQFALKIGIKGDVVVGPAGSPGTYSAGLRIEVVRESDKKALFSKTYPVSATTDGVVPGKFEFVTEPINLPLTRVRLSSDYSISVAFAGARAAPVAGRHHRHGG